MSENVLKGALVVRLTLTGALLVMVFRETGLWTVVALALATLSGELQAWFAKPVAPKTVMNLNYRPGKQGAEA